MLAYRKILYDKYQSAFKRQPLGRVDYAFSDSKLIPLLNKWVSDLDRHAPCVDLGCGDGSLLHALQTLGFETLFGVDVSAEQVALARTVAPQASVGDLFEYLRAFDDGYFGLVTLFDVLEHLTKEEIFECVALIARKLRPGGVWICHLPNGDSPFVGTVQFGDLTHETILNPASARNLCSVFGFERFEAAEHLGASRDAKGVFRALLWRIARLLIIAWNIVETGAGGSGLLTRNFAFGARKPH